MKDRDLPAQVVLRAFVKLGCEARFDGSFLLVIRRFRTGPPRIWKQHLHKGQHDTLRRYVLKTGYGHKLGFSSDAFYAAVDSVS